MVDVLRDRTAMLAQAAGRSDDRTQAIIGAYVDQLSDDTKAYLPSIDVMRRGIQRIRQGRNPVAPRPDDRGFNIPPE